MFMLKILAVPALILGVFAKHQARRIQASGDLVLDVLVTHPAYHHLGVQLVPRDHTVPHLSPRNLRRHRCALRRSILVAGMQPRFYRLGTDEQAPYSILTSLTSHRRTARLGSLLRSPLQTLSRSIHVVLFSGQDFGQQWRVLRVLRLKGAKVHGASITRPPHLTRRLPQIYPDTHDLTCLPEQC
ncbi:hypothetical protein BDZ89DRAFT_1081179 [Hymenopellis radicata]|nr:hypothetical protein BDZ89DRAFT_1081179 [Hymenopellis radicata]